MIRLLSWLKVAIMGTMILILPLLTMEVLYYTYHGTPQPFFMPKDYVRYVTIASIICLWAALTLYLYNKITQSIKRLLEWQHRETYTSPIHIQWMSTGRIHLCHGLCHGLSFLWLHGCCCSRLTVCIHHLPTHRYRIPKAVSLCLWHLCPFNIRYLYHLQWLPFEPHHITDIVILQQIKLLYILITTLSSHVLKGLAHLLPLRR